MDDRDRGDSLIDDRAFRREQEALRSTWTFLGLTVDLPRDHDWFRTSLAGRSVFVQRFGEQILGFENICPHRFFPLRTADKGNGQIICGFHHWHFDRRDDAVGIPNCREVFDLTPREMKARLRPIEIAMCGTLIFGRLDAAPDAESLEGFLAGSADILAAFSRAPVKVQRFGRTVEANWRLMIQITLDDYHVPAVHQLRSHIGAADYRYWRFGPHSAMAEGHTDTLPSTAEDCAAGRYRPTRYRIFNIFPTLAVSLFSASHYWYIDIQQFIPLAPARSQWRHWVFPAPFQTARKKFVRSLTRPLVDPIRDRIVRRTVERIGNEDHLACERLQQVAHQPDHWQPILGRQEERVAWFTEAYAKAVSDAP